MKTLLTKFKIAICGILALGLFSSYAQKAESPDYKYDLGAKINEMTLTDGGNLVIATNDGLVGVAPGNPSPVFTFNEFGKLKEDETEYIPNSPYIVVSQGATGQMAGLSKSKRAVIDYMRGKVLFNSDTDNWNQIYTCNVVLPQNKLIVSGLRKEGNAAEKVTARVAVYDLESGSMDYSFFMSEPGKVTMKSFLVTGTPLLLKESIIIPTSQGLISKTHSGETLWENKMKNINWMVADDTEKEIYAFEGTSNGKNTRIHKVGSNGAELWQDDRKVKGSVVNFEILPQGIAVVSNVSGGDSALSAKSESKIAFLDANNGEDLWEKAPKTKGYVQHFYVMDDGILFGIQSGGINKISFDGNTLFKKPLKTGENIITMAHTPQGLIYITSEDANIVDLKTGDQVWEKPLKYKRAESVTSAYDEKNSRYMISADGEIYAVDANSGNISTFAKYKFDEKEEPTTLQIRDNGVFIASDQNLAMFGFDGSENFHEYFKSPGQSGFLKVISAVAAVASTAMASAAAYRAGANTNSLGDYTKVGAEHNRQAEMFSSIGGAAWDMMSKRFKATAATEDSQFILTKLDGGVGLVKVDKDSGNPEKEILLKDKKPEYQVDEFGGYLYYKAADDTVYSYDLNK